MGSRLASTGLLALTIFAACSAPAGLGAACAYEIVFDSDREGSTDVYLLDLETLDTRRVTRATPGISNRLPDWSPDGRTIVFVSEDGAGQGNLFLVSPDGSNLRQLTHQRGRYDNPAWSPRGDQIAFELEREGEWALYLIRPDGSQKTRIGPTGANLFHPSWSPNATELAVVTGSEVAWVGALLDLETAQLSLMTPAGIDVGSIKWSPDGRRLAFDGVTETNFDLYVVATGDDAAERLTTGPAVEARPEWSPDGSTLVFHTTRDYGSVGGAERWEEFELYLLNLRTRVLTRLTHNTAFDAHPDWCAA